MHVHQKKTFLMSPKYHFIYGLLLLLLLSACGNFKKGYKKYEKQEYEEAISYFKKVVVGKDALMANFYTAQSLRKSNRIREAESYYAKVYNKPILKAHSDDHVDDAKFYYGIVLKANGKYKEAQEQLQNYAQVGKNVPYVQRARKEIENIKKIEEILRTKTYYEIENCDALNSSAAEFSPIPFGDNQIIFSSSRKQGVFAGNGQNFTGLYAYRFDTDAECQGRIEPFAEYIHMPEVNEASATFSRDGMVMVFARGNTGKKKGNKNVKLFISNFENGTWTEPQIIEGVSSNDEKNYYGKPGKKSKTKAFVWDSCPAFSPDGKTLYFASDREYDDRNNRSRGGIDLFSASRNPDGSWGNVRNLGSDINTEGDDLFPYVSNDGRLFFASDGHPGLGGLDIFVATRQGGQTRVRNMGVPVNSKYDDLSLVFTSDSTGYFASNREKGKGDDDIYRFIDKTPKTKTIRYFLAFNTIAIETDKREQVLPKTRVRVLDKNERLIKEMISDSRGRTDTLSLGLNDEFVIIADHLTDKSPYLTARESFTMAGRQVPLEFLTKPETDTVFFVDMKLQKFEVQKTKFEVYVLYDFNKYNIRPDAAKVLDGVVTFLRDNPEVKVELGSHTDSRGTNFDNEILAQNRAQSAVDYIISKGINRNRITPQGYGEREPKVVNAELAEKYDFLKEGEVLTEKFIESFKDEERRELLHQLNRRTEIKITGVQY